MLHITVRQLEVFSTVARRRSFVRAAEELHLTPPAVSMQIKQLEAQLGFAALERAAADVRPTPAGEMFLTHARKMLATLKEAEDLVARLRQAQTGSLALGMLSTAKYFVPHLLSGFLAEHPGVQVRLVEGNREQLLERIHRNEVDLAVMGRAPGELEARTEVVGVHPLGVVASPGHALARARRIAPERLADQAFVIRESGSGARLSMEAFFREHHMRPTVLMQMSSNETIKQAVMAGMGIAFLSLHTAAAELAQGSLVLIDVRGLPVLRNWHVVCRRTRVLSPAGEALRDFLVQRGPHFLSTHFAGLDRVLARRSSPAPKLAARRSR